MEAPATGSFVEALSSDSLHFQYPQPDGSPCYDLPGPFLQSKGGLSVSSAGWKPLLPHYDVLDWLQPDSFSILRRMEAPATKWEYPEEVQVWYNFQYPQPDGSPCYRHDLDLFFCHCHYFQYPQPDGSPCYAQAATGTRRRPALSVSSAGWKPLLPRERNHRAMLKHCHFQYPQPDGSPCYQFADVFELK